MPHPVHAEEIKLCVQTGQLVDMPTRELPTRGLVISRTGLVADWTTHG